MIEPIAMALLRFGGLLLFTIPAGLFAGAIVAATVKTMLGRFVVSCICCSVAAIVYVAWGAWGLAPAPYLEQFALLTLGLLVPMLAAALFARRTTGYADR